MELVEAGMDVARLNLSHGSYDDHEKVYRMVREASDKVGKSVGVLVDLQGPKIRLGRLPHGPVDLEAGDELIITTREVGTSDPRLLVPTTYAGLPGDVHTGDHVLIDDGRVHLEVLDKDETDVRTRVVVPGRISNHKGINLPGVPVSVPAMTDKDRADLRWALHQTVDLIALSFVRSADDAAEVREIMDEEGVHLPVVAKIEKPQAI
jgi:pyruvate kinase